jgi:succinate-semialdehyde dehydrogenase/glutarate-semialdehyde dehydrogenase
VTPGATIDARNPATGETLGQVPSATGDDARAALSAASAAQPAWEALGFEGRARVLLRFRDLVVDQAESIAADISRESGKTIQEALAMEVLAVVASATYFAGRAHRILAPRPIRLRLLRHRASVVHYRPRGVVLVISPWNYPFSIACGEILMALASGNTVVHKPSPLASLIALRTRALMSAAGLHEDVLRVVPGPGEIGARLIDAGVDYVSFTGSSDVGARVAEACGRRLIACHMELGGTDPAIVCADAPLDRTVNALIWGGFGNAGQSCAAIERVYVHESLHDALVARVVERVRALRPGNPISTECDLGAITDSARLAVIERHVADAVARGARVLCGGRRRDGPGNFYEPTVLVDVTEDMAVMREETFGPVLPIARVRDDDEAVTRANDSDYGLTACVFTRDRRRGFRLASRLRFGTVMLNDAMTAHGLPETPWGGLRRSGLGRTHSDDGLRALCHVHHVNYERVPGPRRDLFWPPYSTGAYRALLLAMRLIYRSGAKAKLAALASVGTLWRRTAAPPPRD